MLLLIYSMASTQDTQCPRGGNTNSDEVRLDSNAGVR